MSVTRPVSECPSEELLTELVEGILQAEDRDAAVAHLGVCSACRTLVAGMAPGASAPPPSEESAWSLPTCDPQAYDLGREIARGGMGRILEAFDLRHRRRVAVKMLLQDEPFAKARFSREVRITSRLQHPSIIPLYEAGVWPATGPFFVMKLVAGRSLGAAIREAASFDDRLLLLAHVVAMTDAMAYAHGQGVVHRDLKPTNVLVGRFGETVVIDWGLAKALDEAESTEARPESASNDPAVTVAGRALGTPAYMPPEQARGEVADARSDVYSLGAILYHVLAGVPPFAARSSDELLRQVLSSEPERLSNHVPEVPSDLASIVSTAMHRDPARRYPSAEAMAADLKRYADGRRVSVHRYSLGALVGRWVAAHRAVFATLVCSACLLGLVGALSLRRIIRERDRADQLKGLAEERERTAVGRRDAAEELSNYMVVDLRSKLASVGRLDLMAGVASEVLRYYRSVASLDDSATADALGNRAAAFLAMADVETSKGNHALARDAAEEAVALRERAVAIEAADPEQRARLAESYLSLARSEQELTHADAARSAIDKATALATELLDRDPTRRRFQRVQADVQQANAKQLRQRGDMAAELAALQSARDALASIVGSQPDDVDAAKELGEVYEALGNVYVRQGRADDSEAAGRSAVAVFERLGQRDPTDSDAQERLAKASRELANGEWIAGDLDAAIEADARCVQVLDPCVARDPENQKWQALRAQCQGGIGAVGVPLGRLKEARSSEVRALSFEERAALAHPESETASRMVALALHDLARIDAAEHKYADAYEHLHRAIGLFDDLLRRDPSRALWLRTKADMEATLTQVELGRQQTPAALEAAARAEELLTDLLGREAPADSLFGLRGHARRMLGDVRLARGEPREARTAYESSLGDFERFEHLAGGFVGGEWLPDEVEAAEQLATLLARSGQTDAAGERLARTQSLLERLDKEGRLRGPLRSLLAHRPNRAP